MPEVVPLSVQDEDKEVDSERREDARRNPPLSDAEKSAGLVRSQHGVGGFHQAEESHVGASSSRGEDSPWRTLIHPGGSFFYMSGLAASLGFFC